MRIKKQGRQTHENSRLTVRMEKLELRGGTSLSREAGHKCTWLDSDDSIETKNKKNPEMQHRDFEDAAGLNLQDESHDLILFATYYRR